MAALLQIAVVKRGHGDDIHSTFMLADANNLQDGELQRKQPDARRVGQSLGLKGQSCLKRIEALKIGFDVTRGGTSTICLHSVLECVGQHCCYALNELQLRSIRVVLPDLQSVAPALPGSTG